MAASTSVPALGITYVPYLPPEHLRDLVVTAEASGLDEVWVWEDCFKQSGLAAAAAALAWTSRIRVGIGLLPVPLRNVALTAMEIATLARLFPGRLIPGIGHGVQPWMGQAGAQVSSPLTLLREYATALRSLLAGEEVTVDGRYVRLDGVRLEWPPEVIPPLGVGGAGPRSVSLAGEVGDLYLMGAAQNDEEIADAIARASRASNRPGGGRLPTVATQIVAIGEGARQRVDRELPIWGKEPDGGLGSAGDAPSVAADLRRLAGLGATSIAIQPTADEPDLRGLVEFLGREVKPLLDQQP